MKTVPLHGKKAAGRVVRVDDGDYDLVMQYRWNVYERPATATTRGSGPYATTNIGDGRAGRRSLRMHCLIMGAKGIDHRDHDGLNNQRSNLRVATQTQNAHNMRSHRPSKSSYKGVIWSSHKRRWTVKIIALGRAHHIGYFWSELEAAYAYDAAAREYFGEFACTNFPEGPAQEMRDEWEHEAAEHSFDWSADRSEWWAQREAETRVCTICGKEYQTRCSKPTLYCGVNCNAAAKRRRAKERELEGRLF